MNRFFKKVARLFASISQSINRSHIFAYASQAALFVVISIIPFLMLLLNILQVFLPVSAEILKDFSKDFLPFQVHSFANTLIEEFSDNINIPVLSLTSVALVWTASRGVNSIARGIKLAFRSSVKSNYLKDSLFSLLYTFAFILFILIVVTIVLFGETITDIIKLYLPGLAPFQTLIKWRYVILIIILVFVFMSAYKFLGKTKIPFTKMLVGALFSSLGVVTVSLSYSIYIENFSKASYIYGSLAAVMFLLLWIWLCMVTLLLGAHINRFIYENKQSIFKKIKGFWQKC